MKDLLNKITKNFIINEGKGPTFQTWIQSLSENLESLSPRTRMDERRIELMRHQLKELKRSTQRMHNEMVRLQEEISFLQEQKNEQL